MPHRKKIASIYTPSQRILEKYADVMINFALNDGRGLKKGEIVRITAEEIAKPFYAELQKAVWKAGGHVIGVYLPSDTAPYGLSRDFYRVASAEQLNFFPAKLLRGMIDQIDHALLVLGGARARALAGIDPQKILASQAAWKPFMDWRNEKENKGKFSWTLALYGTEASAREAGLNLKEYWQQIINACYLKEKDPVAQWKKTDREVQELGAKLDKLALQSLHIKGPDVDLHIKLGEKRKWIAGGGKNIPSFEVFTSPDWRGTEGWIKFNQPLYRYGNLLTGIELEFKNGRVVKSRARKNEKLLKQMIATEGADRVGEFSLTDKRHSRITRFMAETLFDENMGGPQGNTHIALGNSYSICYAGNVSKVKKSELKKLGFNESVVHTDIISTAPRVVTATLKDGSERVIYKDGMFTL